MPQIKAIVEIVFDVEGPMDEAQQGVREQIYSDLNDYYQNPNPKVQMKSIVIKGVGLIE